jgi:hypothetical protein
LKQAISFSTIYDLKVSEVVTSNGALEVGLPVELEVNASRDIREIG